MSTRLETITEICAAVTQLVRERHRTLTLHFVLTTGDRQAAARQQAVMDLAGHPAERSICRMLGAETDGISPLAGIAVARQTVFFGLATHDQLLALPLLDIGRHAEPKEARSQAYHLAWHALDAYDLHRNPKYHSSLTEKVRLPQRTGMAAAFANLEADIFAVALGGLLGESSGVQRLAVMRARAALEPQPAGAAEGFPLAIAIEAADFALRQAKEMTSLRRNYIDAARKAARAIVRTVAADELDVWHRFAAAAQAMAWRGATPDQILGAATTTSDDVEIRTLGHLVSDLTGISPAPAGEIEALYSAFASDAVNTRLHRKASTAALRMTLGRAIRIGSAQPFVVEAARQTAALRDGQTLGWCGAALAAAGRAVAPALDDHRDIAAVAQREFEQEEARWPWSVLQALGDDIAGRRRGGGAVTGAEVDRLLRSIRDPASDAARQPKRAKPLDTPAAATLAAQHEPA